MRFSYCLLVYLQVFFVYLQPEPGSRGGVAVYDSRVGAVIRRCIKPSHVIHLALHKQVFLYIEPSSLHITILPGFYQILQQFYESHCFTHTTWSV